MLSKGLGLFELGQRLISCDSGKVPSTLPSAIGKIADSSTMDSSRIGDFTMDRAHIQRKWEVLPGKNQASYTIFPRGYGQAGDTQPKQNGFISRRCGKWAQKASKL